MGPEQSVDFGLDQDLKDRVAREFIRDGRLFGAVRQSDLIGDEMMELVRAGWTQHDYHDAPVMEAPHSTVDWLSLKLRHRDNTLHAVSHQLKNGAPWVGPHQEILEELLASTWEVQEDELRTLLHAFAFASMWNREESSDKDILESQETFFFYTDRMRSAALRAADYATEAPESSNPFWEMVMALHEVRE